MFCGDMWYAGWCSMRIQLAEKMIRNGYLHGGVPFLVAEQGLLSGFLARLYSLWDVE